MFNSKILRYVFLALCFYWIIFTTLEYFEIHSQLLNFGGFFNNLFFILATGGLIAYLLKTASQTNWNKLTFRNVNLSFKRLFIYAFLVISFILIGYALSYSFFESVDIVSGSAFILGKFFYLLSSLIFLTLSAYLIGNLIINRIANNLPLANNFVYSTVTGILLIVLLMFIAGSFGLLNFYTVAGIVLLGMILNWKSLKSIATTLKDGKVEIKEIKPVGFAALTIITIALTVYLITLIRPVPIGWDDTGLYMSIPRLISSSGELVQGFAPYNWSLFMSLGFLLFNSTEVAMGISALGGFLVLPALYSFFRRFMGTENIIKLITLITVLPSLQFMFTQDMKVDLGLLFVSISALDILLFSIQNKNIKMLGLSGILIGFAFGIKFTSFLLVIGAAILLGYRYFKLGGAALVFSLSFLSIFLFDLLKFSGTKVAEADLNRLIYFSVFATAASLILLIYQNRSNLFSRMRRAAPSFLILILGITAGFAPWTIKNYSETHSLGINQLLYGAVTTPSLKLETDDIEAEEGFTPLEATSGVEEELVRYSGYEADGLKYPTLPYDVIMNTNVKNQIVNIGFLLLSVLPIAALLYVKSDRKWIKTLTIAGAILFFLFPSFLQVISRYSCERGSINSECLIASIEAVNKTGGIMTDISRLPVFLSLPVDMQVMKFLENLDTSTIMIILAVVYIGITLLLVRSTGKSAAHASLIIVFTIPYMYLWHMIGGGIYWYGMLGFVLLFGTMFIFLENFDQKNGPKLLVRTMNFLVALSIFVAFAAMFNKSLNNIPGVNETFSAYKVGGESAEEVSDQIIKVELDAAEAINQTDGNVYKVGTFINYFIEDSNTRVLSDNQLDTFVQIYNTGQGRAGVTQILKNSGFEFILVDLNTATIDQTAEQSLTNKFNALTQYLTDNPDLELIATDRIVVDPEGENTIEYKGEDVKASRAFTGEIVHNGKIAAFRIR